MHFHWMRLFLFVEPIRSLIEMNVELVQNATVFYSLSVSAQLVTIWAVILHKAFYETKCSTLTTLEFGCSLYFMCLTVYVSQHGKKMNVRIFTLQKVQAELIITHCFTIMGLWNSGERNRFRKTLVILVRSQWSKHWINKPEVLNFLIPVLQILFLSPLLPFVQHLG